MENNQNSFGFAVVTTVSFRAWFEDHCYLEQVEGLSQY